CATSVNWSRSSASMKAVKFSACCSGVYEKSRGRSESPKPRWSGAMQRRFHARPATTWRHSNDHVGVPCTNTIGSAWRGPSSMKCIRPAGTSSQRDVNGYASRSTSLMGSLERILESRELDGLRDFTRELFGAELCQKLESSLIANRPSVGCDD